MIVWSSSIDIHRPPEVVFEFLANIQDVQQFRTPGPVRGLLGNWHPTAVVTISTWKQVEIPVN
jgi:hypothetical protein